MSGLWTPGPFLRVAQPSQKDRDLGYSNGFGFLGSFTSFLQWFKDISWKGHRRLQLPWELILNGLKPWHPGTSEVKLVKDVNCKNWKSFLSHHNCHSHLRLTPFSK
jgi:hypothetical protein